MHYRITYKPCTLIHNVHIGKSPRYLVDIVQPTSSRVTRSGLRSLSLKQPDTSHLGCAPSLESGLSLCPAQCHGTLPTELRTIPDTSVLKNKLKTSLFKLAFDIQRFYQFVFYSSHAFCFYCLLVFTVTLYCSAPVF